ncbi:hypothetical protein ZIOFF_044816 [Zingiber officinale]|uniref:Mitochondrial fission 1 protein n=1 Tax=Zingiber officinale TaxID=94328 RepID=A0A8J5FZS4_ZINOF|nr:hypothetical protein ZIOFF_044816 [Zingiber officinale]
MLRLSQGCEREVAESDSSEAKNECLMRLSWALVHSRHPEDVNRGIAMLEANCNLVTLINYLVAASLDSSASPLQTREKLYLLAVGFYRNGDYLRSRQILEQCLQKALLDVDEASASPVTSQMVQNSGKIVHMSLMPFLFLDGMIGIGIAATGVGLLVAGIAALATRK